MKESEQSNAPPDARGDTLPETVAGNGAAREKLSFPAVVANTFCRFDIALRARLLGRLLGSVGPLALVVVGGGVFAKYVRHARWAEIPVSLEDAARATTSQVYDLVRYVEQSNPHLVQGLLTALSRDDVKIAAGASIAAIAIRRLSERKGQGDTSSAK